VRYILSQGVIIADSSLKKSSILLLLVSDPIVRSVMNDTFEREGYSVWATGDLGHAADYLKMSTPDLLITRTYVEGLSGHDAAKYLRMKCLTMKVLIVGGLLADDRLYNREALEGFEVFPKPYPAAQLLKKVKEVLSTPRG
jgi:DNA-binding NtrC family response regulator